MKQNEGFSLVELIVVIAILAILSTAAVMGIGMTRGWQMNQCVELIAGGLNETRMDALSREVAYFIISCDADGNFYVEESGHPKEKIANKQLVIAYTTDAQPNEEVITTDQPLVLSYDRASGAFLPILEWDTTTGAYVPKQTGEGVSRTYVYCTAIRIHAGEEKNATIILSKCTGKHEIE